MSRGKLLVLDDNAEFADVIRQFGEGEGFDVTVLTESTQFRNTYDTEKPDWIILDMIMPDMDGVEIIEWLSQVNNSVPVLLISGYNPAYSNAAKQIANAKGQFQVFSLTKPVSFKDLRSVLAQLE